MLREALIGFYSHALVGRDTGSVLDPDAVTSFYSHALVGRDKGIALLDLDTEVSTHTPSWGVTQPWAYLRTVASVSTHTPSWGVTSCPGRISSKMRFLLTRPRGA